MEISLHLVNFHHIRTGNSRLQAGEIHNISYIELVFYENQKWKDYYILEKTIYINNNFEYQGQMQYQKIVKNYYFIIHKDYLNKYLMNFEKENLIYIPDIQKNIDKISNF